MTREEIAIWLILIVDLWMAYEQYRASSVMKMYFSERKKWYEARGKVKKSPEYGKKEAANVSVEGKDSGVN